MPMIRFAMLFAVSALVACEGGKGGRFPDAGEKEDGITRAPDGIGFCCPIDGITCNCFRNGGWIARDTDLCPSVCDLAPVDTRISIDEHGCQLLSGPESCLAPPAVD
jgi:hypothetical protein